MSKRFQFDDEQVTAMIDSKMTRREIVAELGCSLGSLRGYLRRRGIVAPRGRPGRAWPTEDLRQWIEVDGWTHEQVAEQLGCAPQTVGKLCAKHGIQPQRRGPRSGPGHPNWKGGRLVEKGGYVLVWTADHPQARQQHRVHGGGYVLEHRLVVEADLGRYLTPDEVVHHKNGDPSDNRLENLEMFATNADHLRHELAGRVPNWTEDGKARIRAGSRKGGATSHQRKIARDLE